MENLEIEWSCYLRGGRRVLWNMWKTYYKTWCSSICLDTFSKAPHWGTESFAAHFNLTFIIFMSPHLTLSASQSLLSLTVTSTLRLTMGSSGHGPALLSPAPGRCRDIATAGAMSGLGPQLGERSPGSPRSRGARDHQETRILTAVLLEILWYEWWSHLIISNILERFCFSANYGWSNQAH